MVYCISISTTTDATLAASFYSPTIHTYDSCEHAKTTHKPIRKERVVPQLDNSLVWDLARTGRRGYRRRIPIHTEPYAPYALHCSPHQIWGSRSLPGVCWLGRQATWGTSSKRLHFDCSGEFPRAELDKFLKGQVWNVTSPHTTCRATMK